MATYSKEKSTFTFKTHSNEHSLECIFGIFSPISFFLLFLGGFPNLTGHSIVREGKNMGKSVKVPMCFFLLF